MNAMQQLKNTLLICVDMGKKIEKLLYFQLEN